MSESDIIAAEEAPAEITPLVGGFEPTAQDIDIPRLNVVQAVSQIEAPHGSIVLDKRHVLTEVEQPITAIPVAEVKGFREDKPYGVGEMARSVYTEEDLALLKADTEYPLIEFANVTIMFPEPKHAKGGGAFPFKIGKTKYAIGTMNVAKVAYKNTYKRLITHMSTRVDEPYYGVYWDLTPLKIEGKVTYYAPSLTVQDTEDTVPKDVVKFIERFRKG